MAATRHAGWCENLISIMQAPERYAVIGHPIAHSRSPLIHALFAQQTRQDLVYTAIDVTSEQLLATVREFFAAGGRGLNVTIPHKQAVIGATQALSARAHQAGAVNTLLRAPQGGLLGENTDGVGLLRDLQDNLRQRLGGARVLLLGAGGAARGVIAPLLEQQPRELTIANRTLARAQALAAQFAPCGPVRAAAIESLAQERFELIINATAASLTAQLPELPGALLTHAQLCYDMSYADEDTVFVRWAREHGAAHACMGLGMLVEQAAESFYLWRGVRPDTAPVLAHLQRRAAAP
jgi:shikimate dehydrogenase